jgi:hypothetical protein
MLKDWVCWNGLVAPSHAQEVAAPLVERFCRSLEHLQRGPCLSSLQGGDMGSSWGSWRCQGHVKGRGAQPCPGKGHRKGLPRPRRLALPPPYRSHPSVAACSEILPSQSWYRVCDCEWWIHGGRSWNVPLYGGLKIQMTSLRCSWWKTFFCTWGAAFGAGEARKRM